MRILVSAVVAALLLGSSGASAREFGDITGPYMQKYGDWKKTRSALRKQLKKDQPMSGDDWFVLAAMCNIEPPEGPSKILNFANRSPCKDEVVEYFVKAGMEGTPEGFYEAAKMIGSGDAAWLYAELAYRLAGNDTAFEDKAFSQLEEIWLDPASEIRMKQQAAGMVAQLASEGPYRGRATAAASQDSAGQGRGRARVASEYRSPPPIARGGTGDLRWLDFDNPAKCAWSQQAQSVMEGSYRFDDNRMTNITVPATTRLPGGGQAVTGRVSWPSGRNSNHVQIDIDFRGKWNGLTVLGLTDAFLEESDGLFGKGIRFAEPVSEVARALRNAGFVVNLDGSEREQADEVETSRYEGKVYRNINGVRTSIARQGGETVFLCNQVWEIMG